MGNIRPTYVKRAAIELLKRYPEQFTNDYDHNKKALGKVAVFQSQDLRNKVAGYIVRHRKVLERKE
jgi:small subunit ribosomal protein S17e